VGTTEVGVGLPTVVAAGLEITPVHQQTQGVQL